jgi:hypothetical protein
MADFVFQFTNRSGDFEELKVPSVPEMWTRSSSGRVPRAHED